MILKATALILMVLGLSLAGVSIVKSTQTAPRTVAPVIDNINRVAATDQEVNQSPGPISNSIPTKDTVPVKFIELNNDSRVVILDTPVFDDSVNTVIAELELLRKSGISHVYLVITSPGGSVLAGGRLIAYMDATPLHIDTVCETECASMAAHIHQAGKRRLMIDRSMLMFHRASGGVSGTIEQMDSQNSFFKLYVDRMDANASRRSGIEFSTFKDMVGRDLYIDSQTALSLHLADGIVFLPYTKEPKLTFKVTEELKKYNIVTPPEFADGAVLNF